MRSGKAWLLATAVSAVGLGACGGGDINLPCRTPPVSVSPPVLQLTPGAQATVTALGVVTTAQCQRIASTVRWDAQDTIVARVHADSGFTARVTAVAPGSTFVIATFVADTTVRAAVLVEVGPPGQQ